MLGPGEYYKPSEPENRGYYFNVSPREPLLDLDSPGPGSYTVSTFVSFGANEQIAYRFLE